MERESRIGSEKMIRQSGATGWKVPKSNRKQIEIQIIELQPAKRRGEKQRAASISIERCCDGSQSRRSASNDRNIRSTSCSHFLHLNSLLRICIRILSMCGDARPPHQLRCARRFSVRITPFHAGLLLLFCRIVAASLLFSFHSSCISSIPLGLPVFNALRYCLYSLHERRASTTDHSRRDAIDLAAARARASFLSSLLFSIMLIPNQR